MIPPIQSPNFLTEWTDAIVNLQFENIKILLNIDPELLWTQLPYNIDHNNELYIGLIQSLRLGSSVQPLSALQYCIIHYHQSENRVEDYNIISYLIEQATLEDLNTQYWGDCNNSTLHLVCFMGQLDVLDLLLKKDVFISIKNNLGFSPCHVASNQAILDGLSFYEQKKKQQQNSGTNVSQKFKMLRDLAEGTINNNNKPKSRPALKPHYFRTGYVKEAQKVLTKEPTQEERKVQKKEVAQLAKRSAVKNNLKQFENHQNEEPTASPQIVSEHRRRLSFNPIVNSNESSRPKRDSAIISSLKKSNLVSSSTLRQQLNERKVTQFTDDLNITELYSGRPSTIIEEHQSQVEPIPEEFYDIIPCTEHHLEEEEPEVSYNDILETITKGESTGHLEQYPSTTESILDGYTPNTAPSLLNNDPLHKDDDCFDIEMCRKVLQETKNIENEIDILLAETEGSSHDDASSTSEEEDGNLGNKESKYSDEDSFQVLHAEVLKEQQFIETDTQEDYILQALEQESSATTPSLRPITLSIPASSFSIIRDYSNTSSRKLSGGSQRAVWTTSLISWSSSLEGDITKHKSAFEKMNTESFIEEQAEYEYTEAEEKELDPEFEEQAEKEQLEEQTVKHFEEQAKEQEEEKDLEEVELRQIRNTLDITDEDLKLMLHRGSSCRSTEKGGIDRSSALRMSSESGSLSVEDILSNSSSTRSSSSIKTADAIFYTATPDPPSDKKPDDISDFYPPLPPVLAPVEEIPPKNYHTCDEKHGKLHVHVHGIQGIKLPLPKEPTLVRCVVSDGRFEYISDYKKLEIDIEFDHKCTIDIYPGMSITVSLHVHPDYVITTSKAQPFMNLLKKHRNCFTNYISKDDGAIGLAFCDISNCLPMCREEYFRASICCFNTWYSKSFLERHTRKKNALDDNALDIAGKFDMDMFYLPVS